MTLESFILFCLYGALAGVWASLFTGPLSTEGEVFGWLKELVYRRCPEWLYKPLIGCAKCHAFWLALLICLKHHSLHYETIILAVFVAYILQEKVMR